MVKTILDGNGLYRRGLKVCMTQFGPILLDEPKFKNISKRSTEFIFTQEEYEMKERMKKLKEDRDRDHPRLHSSPTTPKLHAYWRS